MKRVIFWSLCISVVAFLKLSGASQSTTEAPKFTSKTELVLVPTVVTDKRGEPVHGLTKEEVQIFEDKKEQNISVFEEITTSQERPQSAPAQSPNEFTNRVTPSGTAARRLTIIAFDLINTPTLRQASARKQLLEFLSEMANSGEPVAVYAITQKGTQVVTDFTTDPKLLASVLQKMKLDHGMTHTQSFEGKAHTTPFDTANDTGGGIPSGSMNITAANAGEGDRAMALQAAMENFVGELELNIGSAQTQHAVQYTLDGMEQIAQACSAIPGRKALIWVTGGFPFDVNAGDMMYNPMPAKGMSPAGRAGLDEVLGLYLRLWRTLNDAQVAVYPIDVQGVMNPALADPSFRNRDPRVEPRARSYMHQQTKDTDSTFAEATGGKAFYDSSDLKKGFAEAFKDSSSYYLIGYYIKPDPSKKIQWREIAVKSARHDVQIRARRGYFYNPTTADLHITRDHDLSAGLYSPVDFTAISMTVRWKGTAAGAATGKNETTFEVELPANFAQVDADDNNHMVFDIVAQARTPDGRPVGEIFTRTLDAHLNPTQLEQVRERGMTYASQLELPVGQYIVRFVVRDGLNGHMGSLAAPLKVQ